MANYNTRITITKDSGLYTTREYTDIDDKMIHHKNYNYMNTKRIEKFTRKDQIVTIPDSVLQQSIITYIHQVWVNDLNTVIDCYKITIPNGDNYYVIRSDFPETNRTEKLIRLYLGDSLSHD